MRSHRGASAGLVSKPTSQVEEARAVWADAEHANNHGPDQQRLRHVAHDVADELRFADRRQGAAAAAAAAAAAGSLRSDERLPSVARSRHALDHRRRTQSSVRLAVQRQLRRSCSGHAQLHELLAAHESAQLALLAAHHDGHERDAAGTAAGAAAAAAHGRNGRPRRRRRRRLLGPALVQYRRAAHEGARAQRRPRDGRFRSLRQVTTTGRRPTRLAETQQRQTDALMPRGLEEQQQQQPLPLLTMSRAAAALSSDEAPAVC